jgi:DNA modification methylase
VRVAGVIVTPYYQDEFATVYHGDCAEIAPTLGRFDLLCTDPPYGLGEGHAKSRRRAGQVNKSGLGTTARFRDYGDSEWDDVTPCDSLIADLRAMAAWNVLFGGNYFFLPPSTCWLVWDKENSGDFADAELAWTNYGTAVRLRRHRWNGMIRLGNEPRYHPTQKPLAVMSWAIGLCPERPTSVLDPFMGSGTTLRACKDLGIRCVGIDREEKYCEIAARRLGQGVLALGAT